MLFDEGFLFRRATLVFLEATEHTQKTARKTASISMYLPLFAILHNQHWFNVDRLEMYLCDVGARESG